MRVSLIVVSVFVLSAVLVWGAACEPTPPKSEPKAEGTPPQDSGPPTERPASSDAPATGDAVPTTGAALFDWLKAGKYKSFAKESKIHPTDAAHSGKALTFINKTMEDSFKAGNSEHTKGSALIKELYKDDGTTLRGWAVMVKTADQGDGGKGWYWYEILSTTSGASPVADGNGVGLCSGCHSAGKDYVRTPYPLQ